MTLWSTPKKILALLAALGVIATVILVVAKPSSDNLESNQTTNETSSEPTGDEFLEPTNEVQLDQIPLDQISSDQNLYFQYLSKSSTPVGELFKISSEFPKISAEYAKDPTNKATKKESDKLALVMKEQAEALLAIKPDAAVAKIHELTSAEATIILAAAESLLSNEGDYESYEKALQEFGKAFEKVSKIQGDLLARLEKPANATEPSTSAQPNSTPGSVAESTTAPQPSASIANGN